jgi:predicted RNase H-like nuclease
LRASPPRRYAAGGCPTARRSAARIVAIRAQYPLRMYFAGVDLAWAGRNPTGVAVLDADGGLVHLRAVRDDAAVLAALSPYVQGDCLVAFDAPLVVTNRTGQRPAEAALNRDFRRFEAGAHPASTRPNPAVTSPGSGRSCCC